MTQQPDYWKDQYDKRTPQENTTFVTFVTGGYEWKVAPSGKTYCAGKEKKQ